MAEIKTGYGLFSHMSQEEFLKLLDDAGVEYYSLGEHIERLKSLKKKSECFAKANTECNSVYKDDVETLTFAIQALESCVGVKEIDCRYCNYDNAFYPYNLPNIPDRFVGKELAGERCNSYIEFDKENRNWYIYVPMGSNIPITHCPYCGRKLEK